MHQMLRRKIEESRLLAAKAGRLKRTAVASTLRQIGKRLRTMDHLQNARRCRALRAPRRQQLPDVSHP